MTWVENVGFEFLGFKPGYYTWHLKARYSKPGLITWVDYLGLKTWVWKPGLITWVENPGI